MERREIYSVTRRTTAPSGPTEKYIVPDSFLPYGELIALQSTRNGGESEGPFASLNLGRNTGDVQEHIEKNFQRLCTDIGIHPGRLVTSRQVHGTEILVAEEPGDYDGYDALITDKKNLFLCIFTADCYPVLVYDPRHNASGAIHAGWKGSAGAIVMKTIEAMRARFNSLPEECLAWVGTGISPEAYEVGREVALEFPAESCKRSPDRHNEERYLLDLALVNHQQLLASGVPPANIELSPLCTVRDSTLFFSYRRDQGQTGRMVSLIGVHTAECP